MWWVDFDGVRWPSSGSPVFVALTTSPADLEPVRPDREYPKMELTWDSTGRYTINLPEDD